MLKLLHKNDTQTTSFVVTKNWELSNVINEDSILMEHSGSDGLPVALEYLVLLPNYVITASACNIALEQQADDLARYRSGLKLSGIFYPDADPTNLDGTYQRVVYSQVVNMFYNDYRDPTKTWGLEQIDFDKSQTKRFLSDRFKMFEIPQPVYGEKLIPNTIKMIDRTTDNDYTITDDGNCNLFAGKNLFSYQQELGIFLNKFITGSSNYCNFYNTGSSSTIINEYLNISATSSTISWANNSQSLNAGTYKVTYISNALKYSNIVFSYSIKDPTQNSTHAFYILYNDGMSEISASGTSVQYATIALCQAANTGSYVTFYHTGGRVGMYLFDNPYTDNYGTIVTYQLTNI